MTPMTIDTRWPIIVLVVFVTHLRFGLCSARGCSPVDWIGGDGHGHDPRKVCLEAGIIVLAVGFWLALRWFVMLAK